MLTCRPVRSLLFVPGDRTDLMPKAVASGADAVVFDLEGALAPSEKDAGRRAVRALLDDVSPTDGPVVMARVNDVRSPEFERDVDVLTGPGLAAVLLPQVSGVDDVLVADELLGRTESARGLSPDAILLDPLMETPQALRTAYEIASSCGRIAYMGAGISKRGDIARTMGYLWTEEGLETLYFRSKVLLDVRAAGVPNPLSGMWGDIGDLDGLRGFASSTRALGYEGMMVIHPSHVPVVNEVFSPSAEEVERWREIIDVMDAAHEEGVGVVSLRGEVIDEAHVHTAHQELERARRQGLA